MGREAKGKTRVEGQRTAVVLVAVQKCKPFASLHLGVGAAGLSPCVSGPGGKVTICESWVCDRDSSLFPGPRSGREHPWGHCFPPWKVATALLTARRPHEAPAPTGPTRALLEVESDPGEPGRFSGRFCCSWTLSGRNSRARALW